VQIRYGLEACATLQCPPYARVLALTRQLTTASASKNDLLDRRVIRMFKMRQIEQKVTTRSVIKCAEIEPFGPDTGWKPMLHRASYSIGFVYSSLHDLSGIANAIETR
jgi:hypothetical protein